MNEMQEQLVQLSDRVLSTNTLPAVKTESNTNIEVLKFQIELASKEIGRVHNLYITFITGFTGFLLLILAWLFSGIQFKRIGK
jgi:hypothetical protein